MKIQKKNVYKQILNVSYFLKQEGGKKVITSNIGTHGLKKDRKS